MTRLSPREKRQQRTHQAILDAARQLITEKGLDGLSMRAIAERIDYSPAGLYDYFGSKEEIIAALCQQGNGRLKAYMEAVDQELSFLDYLLGIGLAYIEFAVHYPDLFVLMFTTLPTGGGVALSVEQWLAGATSEDSAFIILLDAIKRGVEEGILRVRPQMGVVEMAFAAWATVHGIAMLRVTHLRPLQTDFEAISRETLLAFGKGLALRSTGVA
ncbi:MAG TPA: TetR/AcrR family transcriptional regulator [Caldilineaceae bacterium]|nr:TetR/AcrR family transcriptional regulator [Caldilineaceae bacterium]